MRADIEPLFARALGLQPPWVAEHVEHDAAKHRIDLEVGRERAQVTCPHGGAAQ